MEPFESSHCDIRSEHPVSGPVSIPDATVSREFVCQTLCGIVGSVFQFSASKESAWQAGELVHVDMRDGLSTARPFYPVGQCGREVR